MNTEIIETPGTVTAEGPLSSQIVHRTSSVINPLLERLVETIEQYVILPPHAAETLALWTLHTYAFYLRDVSTYLGIESPEKRCGKTTLLTVLSELCNRAIVASNISSPAFFRVIEETRPTLLIDEADTFLQSNEEMRGILNSGYTKKTAHVIRVVNERRDERSEPRHVSVGGQPTSTPEGRVTRVPNPFQPSSSSSSSMPSDPESPSPIVNRTSSIVHPTPTPVSTPSTLNQQPSTVATSLSLSPSLATFSTWCPKAIAAIGHLPDTLADRCIVIRMQRKTNQEQTLRLRNLQPKELRQQCEAFVAQHADAIATAQPEIPKDLNDRAADIWEPLLVLADIVGGDWPEKARRAAVALSTRATETNPIGALLMDILVYFIRSNLERTFTHDLVAYLQLVGIRPWNETLKKPITDQWLAQQLRPYGIRPRNLRIEGQQAKGYDQSEMTDAFRRYIPMSEVNRIHEEFEAAEEESKPEPSTNPER